MIIETSASMGETYEERLQVRTSTSSEIWTNYHKWRTPSLWKKEIEWLLDGLDDDTVDLNDSDDFRIPQKPITYATESSWTKSWFVERRLTNEQSMGQQQVFNGFLWFKHERGLTEEEKDERAASPNPEYWVGPNDLVSYSTDN